MLAPCFSPVTLSVTQTGSPVWLCVRCGRATPLTRRSGIDRRTERLVYHVISPCLHPGRGFSSLRRDVLELFNDRGQLHGIGGNEALWVALPRRHDG
jgi:hypothetical protein